MTTELFDPKEQFYEKLNELVTEGNFEGLEVLQERPEVLESFPVITFRLLGNTPMYTLQNEIENQEIRMIVDFWADTSEETGLLVKAAEKKLRELKYRLTFNSDIVDEEGYSHRTTEFTY